MVLRFQVSEAENLVSVCTKKQIKAWKHQLRFAGGKNCRFRNIMLQPTLNIIYGCVSHAALQRGCFNASEHIIIRHLTWFQSATIVRVGGKALSFHVGLDNLPIYLPLTSCIPLTNTFIFNCQTNIALMDIVCWFLLCIIVSEHEKDVSLLILSKLDNVSKICQMRHLCNSASEAW